MDLYVYVQMYTPSEVRDLLSGAKLDMWGLRLYLVWTLNKESRPWIPSVYRESRICLRMSCKEIANDVKEISGVSLETHWLFYLIILMICGERSSKWNENQTEETFEEKNTW